MNTRERFLEIMSFNPNVHSLKWEFGYWGETIENWYRSGLPMKKYPVLSKRLPHHPLHYTSRPGHVRESISCQTE